MKLIVLSPQFGKFVGVMLRQNEMPMLNGLPVKKLEEPR